MDVKTKMFKDAEMDEKSLRKIAHAMMNATHRLVEHIGTTLFKPEAADLFEVLRRQSNVDPKVMQNVKDTSDKVFDMFITDKTPMGVGFLALVMALQSTWAVYSKSVLENTQGLKGDELVEEAITDVKKEIDSGNA